MKIVIFFHKDLRNIIDGQSQYIYGLDRFLAEKTETMLVTPIGFDLSNMERVGIKYSLLVFIETTISQMLFLLKNYHMNSKKEWPPYIFFSEDVYTSVFPLILSKFFGKEYILSLSDFGREYTFRLMAKKGKVFNIIIILKTLIERILVRYSDLVLVRSLWMVKEVKKTSSRPVKVFYVPHKSSIQSRNEEDINSSLAKYGLKGKTVVTFLGNYAYNPNFEAAKNIINEIAPELLKHRANVVLILIGYRGLERLSNLSRRENVVVIGETSNLDDFLFGSDIGIAPMTVAGGTSAKIIDYLTHGMIAVATPEASKGVIPCRSLITCTQAEFTRTLIQTIDNLQFLKEKTVEDRRLIRTHYLSNVWLENFYNEIKKQSS